MKWIKSSYCRTDTPMCVEVYGLNSDFVAVRDSKDKFLVLTFTREEWQTFLDGVKNGEFDLLANADLDAEEMMEQV